MKKVSILILLMMLMLVGCGEAATNKVEMEVSEEPNISVEVNDQTTTQEDKWNEIKEGYELAVIDITITNNSDADYEFNPNYVVLQTDEKQILESDKQPKDKEVLTSYNLEPGKSLTGIVCFDIPTDTTYELYYDDLGNNKFKL